MQVDHFDCRTGGACRYVLVSADGEYGFHGSFHEVRPSELIVQTFTFEGVPDGVALERLTFTAGRRPGRAGPGARGLERRGPARPATERTQQVTRRRR